MRSRAGGKTQWVKLSCGCDKQSLDFQLWVYFETHPSKKWTTIEEDTSSQLMASTCLCLPMQMQLHIHPYTCENVYIYSCTSLSHTHMHACIHSPPKLQNENQPNKKSKQKVSQCSKKPTCLVSEVLRGEIKDFYFVFFVPL